MASNNAAKSQTFTRAELTSDVSHILSSQPNNDFLTNNQTPQSENLPHDELPQPNIDHFEYINTPIATDNTLLMPPFPQTTQAAGTVSMGMG